MIKDKTILIKNIYYMLSYAYTPLTQGGYENVEKEEFENIHNLFAAILAKGIGRQLKQGLYREYVEKMESLPTLRGKIEINGTVKNKLAKQKLISSPTAKQKKSSIRSTFSTNPRRDGSG